MSTIRATYVQHGSSTVPNITLNASGQVIVASGIVSSGTFAAPSGSAAAPGVYFVGDTDTGLYSPGANEVAISTNGTGRLFVDANGHVGIGTSSPLNTNYRFSVVGNRSNFAANSSGLNLYLQYNSSTNGVFIGSPAADVLSFSDSSGSERMRLDSSGRLGLGTSSPNARLEVSSSDTTVCRLVTSDTGSSNILAINNNDSYNYGTIGIASGNGTASGDVFSLGYVASLGGTSTNVLNWTSQGRVGVGSSDTSLGQLQLSGANGVTLAVKNTTGTTGGTEFCQITLNNTSGSSANFESAKIKAISTNGGSNLAHLTFENSGTERARIDSSGRLLVGTSSTSASLTALLQGNSAGATSNAGLLLARGEIPAAAGTVLGALDFSASNHVLASRILCKSDGAWTAGTSQPTRLEISTTADGASSPTQRLGIYANGAIELTNGGLYLAASAIISGAGTNAVRYSTATGRITYDSSSRLIKTDIVDCPYGIDALKRLQPRKYFRTDDQCTEIGFVADEVASVLPEFVPFGKKSIITRNEEDTEEIPLGVNYDKLTAVLTKALQEAIAKIETLEARLASAGI